jgi:lipoate-protein ligase A
VQSRLIIDQPSPGAWNMAVDEALLADAAENGAATLRFYGWNEPTLSLGYFQSYADRKQHVASRNCPVVRRQTGGGAILHDHELTYSITLPASHPFAKQNQLLYRGAHQAFIDALCSTSTPNAPPSKFQIRDDVQERGATPEPFLCFQRQAPGDVFLTSWKMLGSAQRRSQGALLQHGSLLLERSAAAPELPGVSDLLNQTIATDHVIQSAIAALSPVLNVNFLETTLPPVVQSNAAEITNIKYGSPLWTNRR